MLASGWIHETVLHDEVTVSVAPTPTVLSGPNDVSSSAGWDGFVENALGGGQLLTVWVEVQWKNGTQWVPLGAVNAAQFDTPLAVGERRPFFFEFAQIRSGRLMGQASGAGGNALVSDKRSSALGADDLSSSCCHTRPGPFPREARQRQ